MIVITTPTGGIGGQLLGLLLARAGDVPLRVVARDPARLPATVRDRVEVVTGSHGDRDVLDRALDGADAVFWVVPPDPAAPTLDAAFAGFSRAAADAFPAHGVGHVVGVSALGRGTPWAADAGLVTASLAMDDLVAASGVAYRALADAGFMDNVLRQVVPIRDHGVYTDTLAPGRRLPMVATRDIAAAAADLLLDRSWTGVDDVPLLGPEDLSGDDMAAIMSEVLERPVRYRRQDLDELAASVAGHGAGDAFARGLVDMMRAKQEGLDDGVARTPATASPTTFRQWCTEVLAPAVLAPTTTTTGGTR